MVFSGDCEVSLGPLNLINQRRGSRSAGCGMFFNCSLVQSLVLFNLRQIKLCYKGPCFCRRTTPAMQQQALCSIPDPPGDVAGREGRMALPAPPHHTAWTRWHFHGSPPISASELPRAALLAKGISLAVNITEEFSRYLPRFLSLNVIL